MAAPQEPPLFRSPPPPIPPLPQLPTHPSAAAILSPPLFAVAVLYCGREEAPADWLPAPGAKADHWLIPARASPRGASEVRKALIGTRLPADVRSQQRGADWPARLRRASRPLAGGRAEGGTGRDSEVIKDVARSAPRAGRGGGGCSALPSRLMRAPHRGTRGTESSGSGGWNRLTGGGSCLAAPPIGSCLAAPPAAPAWPRPQRLLPGHAPSGSCLAAPPAAPAWPRPQRLLPGHAPSGSCLAAPPAAPAWPRPHRLLPGHAPSGSCLATPPIGSCLAAPPIGSCLAAPPAAPAWPRPQRLLPGRAPSGSCLATPPAAPAWPRPQRLLPGRAPSGSCLAAPPLRPGHAPFQPATPPLPTMGGVTRLCGFCHQRASLTWHVLRHGGGRGHPCPAPAASGPPSASSSRQSRASMSSPEPPLWHPGDP
ncbi:WAS/WASL-interacting protein family member 3-like [Caloenas nicobarica]|uniref:WAS/WASL-interacting protein family member 3-like n=1 Tax=Caloenas nicobarica TaxID=187106 RepID=UPI0032B7BD35